jgi:hypothetical protein
MNLRLEDHVARASHVTGQWAVVDGGYIHLDRALS